MRPPRQRSQDRNRIFGTSRRALSMAPTASAATLVGALVLLASTLTINALLAPPGAAQVQNCPAVPAVSDQPESSFTGELLRRENGVATFKVSTNPRDPKLEVFFDGELSYLQKGESYRVRTSPVAGSDVPTSNVSCGWTLNADGTEVSTERIDLPESALTTLGLAVALGLALAFGLVFILLAIKTTLGGVGSGIRSVVTKRLT